MTTRDPNIDIDIDGHDTDAKLARQRHGQLSALVDGDLAPDQAGFLMRRLAHDPELKGRWQRWHLVGDVLRGQPVVALPGGADGFAARVAAAVTAERARPAGRLRWQHGLGAALAASVAAVALFVARPLSVDSELPAAVVATQTAPMAGSVPPAASPVEPVREVSVPQFVQAGTAPPALDAPPRTDRVVARPATAPQRVAVVEAAPSSQDPVAPDAVGPDAPVIVLAGSEPRPFASPGEPQARPWPRAALGPTETAGAFTVGFDGTTDSPSFYPFEPQLPAYDPRADAAAGDTESTP